MDMKTALAASLLIASFLVTLWLWALVEQIPGVPSPFGGGREAGLGIMVLMPPLRWLTLSAAFVVLLIDGRLQAWAPYGILRFLMAMVGLIVLEIFMFQILFRRLDDSIAPFHWLFSSLMILLPLTVMVGGYLGSRAVFVIGIAASLAAVVWPISPSVDYIVRHPDNEGGATATLASLEKHPDWVKQVSRELDGNHYWSLRPAYLLTLKPAALDEDVQEKCWKVGLSVFAEARRFRDKGENQMPGEFNEIAPVFAGLASIPGPVRDRHHAEFVAVRDLVNFYRTETPDTRHPELPDLNTVDWVPAGK
ncbi:MULTISPECIES: hypothetical protein [unclassified Bradyrhizobium]|uniref:hypothetical protein n=1 Tax=unclassified Bradyrhizobium TaxID=2631580 RepID=UPI0012EC616E|nr:MULTISPECIES: hypothetical protein [unclassified Bradyrhizobium]MCP3466262.1 hypothetical protein [Bradyrhizobium sp. CCGUVB23]